MTGTSQGTTPSSSARIQPGTDNRLTNGRPRVERLLRADPSCVDLVERLVRIAVDGLGTMRLPDGVFAYTRRGAVDRGRPTTRLEGRSLRYSGMVAIGARHLDAPAQRELLGGCCADEAADHFLGRLPLDSALGDVAVAAWAVACTGGTQLPEALRMLDRVFDRDRNPYVVDLSWAVCAYVAARGRADVERRLAVARDKLLACRPGGDLFPHAAGAGRVAGWRSHVGCFADQVYPLQALARLHASGDDPEALRAAQDCADRLCALQGRAGQWWWHYDARNQTVVEGYPVYSVHQHAMAPMALLDLAQAGGRVDDGAITRGLTWLVKRPEWVEPLLRDDLGLTWRKVARRDPRKVVRAVRALSTRFRPRMTLSLIDSVLGPTAVDRECRPYELGWLLEAWMPAPTVDPPPTVLPESERADAGRLAPRPLTEPAVARRTAEASGDVR
ncbi:MAG: hypothetical protein QG608_1035 [Actinomycetota bacterium]|nr:hypothetical protein [Actinomycetota bacterium]